MVLYDIVRHDIGIEERVVENIYIKATRKRKRKRKDVSTKKLISTLIQKIILRHNYISYIM